MNILVELRGRFAAALRQLVDDERVVGELCALVLPSQDPKFGDYQANIAMPLGKRLGKPPRQIATELVAQLQVSDLCEPPQIAGPGFINLRLRDSWLAGELKLASLDVERVGIEPVGEPRSFVLDYSAPNVAKPMHVGHIRSTVIGDALYRVLKFLGHRVTSDNHIGDWGTQFGMIIKGWKIDKDEEHFAREPVQELTRLYRLVNTITIYHESKDLVAPLSKAIEKAKQKLAESRAERSLTDPKEEKARGQLENQYEKTIAEQEEDLKQRIGHVQFVENNPDLKRLADQHSDIGDRVLAETAALHAGDKENRKLWEDFLPACRAEMEQVYDRLGVSFNYTLGESFYQDELPRIVDDLKSKGLARESEGAMCVFLEGHEAPFIVQKKDGAFLYATTDLATIQYRMQHWKPDAILYVVDHRQSNHFKQLFATARLWGYDNVELVHISFGTVLGDDGKPFKTRSGSSVGLMGLLDEAVERAARIVGENDDARPVPLLSAEERRRVAERIGIGAIKYADLAHNRTSDYKFSYDKMLAMTGNTAAYMQYSYARVRSIFDKGGVEESRLRLSDAPISLDHAAERALGLAVLQLSEALDRVVADYRPNYLTDYLFDVAGKYATFFENCPVLKAESDELRTSRLLLCDLTARTLERGLNLLGIEVVERM